MNYPGSVTKSGKPWKCNYCLALKFRAVALALCYLSSLKYSLLHNSIDFLLRRVLWMCLDSSIFSTIISSWSKSILFVAWTDLVIIWKLHGLIFDVSHLFCMLQSLNKSKNHFSTWYILLCYIHVYFNTSRCFLS